MVDVFLKQEAIPMSIESLPIDQDTLDAQKEVQRLIKESLEGHRSISVLIKSDD